MKENEDLIVNAELDPTERQLENDYYAKKVRASFKKLKQDEEFMKRMARLVEDAKKK